MRKETVLKKWIVLFLTILLLSGCSAVAEDEKTDESHAAATVSTEQRPEQDTTESVLTVPAHASDPDTRCAVSGRGKMLETETGYYLIHNTMLFYADKSDLSRWVPVCAKPDCQHNDSGCYAVLVDRIWMSGGRLFAATRQTDCEISELGG